MHFDTWFHLNLKYFQVMPFKFVYTQFVKFREFTNPTPRILEKYFMSDLTTIVSFILILL